MGRVLGRLRLSVTSEESTSIERQREAISAWSESHGHRVIGWAEDVDVSGSVDPFDTPQLGDWLNNNADAFDVIACWKLDRLSRNSLRLSKLFSWCLDHDKTVVSTEEAIDLSTPQGRLIAYVIGFLAEGELEAMRERQLSSRRKLRQAARWAGGKPPYGYRAVDGPNGGRVLEVDPHAYKVVRRIVDAVLAGASVTRVCNELNRDGVVSPVDHNRVCRGEEDTGSPWRPMALKWLLLSPTLVGHAHLGGVTTRDDKGDPVLMCSTPLVTDDERELIAAAVARTTGAPRESSRPGLLSGIALCWFCETPLHSARDRKTLSTGKVRHYAYYRCQNNCTPLVPMESADEELERVLLNTLGEEPVTERVWVPGDSNEAALKSAVAAFDELSATIGTMTSKTARDRLQGQLQELDARIAELETVPTREGRYADRPTGETYRQALERTADSQDDRRALLKRIGVTVRLGVADGNLLLHPVELGDRLPRPAWFPDENSTPDEILAYEERAAQERHDASID
ncbi:recombinase family protein [Mycolicibacterium sp. PDY-3]|uniref:recombinase family protein n=1 Tax=Mycolicibacterium sp. PDY-3 TaxID=3376069 RepID=UPI0037B2A5C3